MLGRASEHRRAGQPGEGRNLKGRHRDGGQDHVPQASLTGRGEPAESDREDPDEHDPQPELRQGLAEQRDDVGRLVDHGSPVCRGDDPERDRDRDAEEHGQPPELEGCRQALQNHLHRGVATPLERCPKVALKRVPEKCEVLLVEGPVQPPVANQRLNLFLGCIVGKKDVHRAARQMREPEDDQRDGEQRDQRLQESDCEKTSHEWSGARPLRSPGRGERLSSTRPPRPGFRTGFAAATRPLRSGGSG